MSARIIKASQVGSLRDPDAYNLVDIQREAAHLTAVATREAAEIVARARREAEEIRERAEDEARAAGRHEGLREATSAIDRQANEIAENRVTEQLMTAIPALGEVAAALITERDQWVQRWEHSAIRISVAIAEKLLQRQLALRPSDAHDMIATTLRLATGQTQLTISLNPADLNAWGDRAPQIVRSLTGCADATLMADDGIKRGGCRIETRHGEIDATVETMLQKIVDELTD